MFDIGFWEIILVGLVALFVFGPERLPSALRAGQRRLNQLRAFGQKLQAELQHELRVQDLHENLKKIEAANYENLTPELERALKELQQAAAQVNQPYAKSKENASEKQGDLSSKNSPVMIEEQSSNIEKLNHMESTTNAAPTSEQEPEEKRP